MKESEGSSILTVIDFSESSKEVLMWSACMAEKLNAHLTILHSYRLNQLDKKEDMVAVKKKLELDAVKNFEQLSRGILTNRKEPADFRAEVGFIEDRVQDYARRNGTIFLVIGLSLAVGNNEMLEEIIKETEVPLVIVPTKVKK
jgi:hypothetical protein